ncbi:MAG TPA: inositol monophosphatase [Arcobacter sp.]|jgi:myo-inositol-1(or 4)-monophosphatase|nr:inositol monophosphatase [Arcobacter sp.]
MNKEKLKEIILEAGVTLKEGFYSKKEITHKGTKDLVTIYDVAIEKFLIEKFVREFSEYNIIAEESDNKNVEFHNSIIIDPIDGTTNFANGVPHVAISVGVYKNKRPLIGMVYNPILEEFFEAEFGNGAYLNGERISVSEESSFQKSLLSSGFPYSTSENKKDLDEVLNKLKTILPVCQDVRRFGAASLDICYVARGMLEGYYEMNLKAWDVAAAIIILAEAGGRFSSIDGSDYILFYEKYIVASNGNIHRELIEKLAL